MNRSLFLIFSVFLLSICASAADKNGSFPVKVVSAQAQSAQVASIGTSSCNFEDYDGYCNVAATGTSAPQVVTLRENDGTTIKAECRDGENCAVPAVDQIANARFVRTGIEVDYRDAANREHKRVFHVVPDVTTVGD